MNSLTIVAIAIVVLVAGYALYGRWLAKTWGIDPKAKTTAPKINNIEIEAAAAFGELLAPVTVNPLKVPATISVKAAITSKVNNKKTEGIIFFLFYQCISRSGHPWIFLHSLQKRKEL